MTSPVAPTAHAGKAGAASSSATAKGHASGGAANAFAALMQALGAADGDPAPALAVPVAGADVDPATVAEAGKDEGKAGDKGDLASALPAGVAAPAPQALVPDLAAAMLAAATAGAQRAGQSAGHPAAQPAGQGEDGAEGAGAVQAGTGTPGKVAHAGRRDAVQASELPAAGPAPATHAEAAAPAAVAIAAGKPPQGPDAAKPAAHAGAELLAAMPGHAAAAPAPDAGQSAPTVPVHQAALPSHPLDAAFAGDIAAEVRVMADAGVQRAELHLNPADLGPVRIELTMTAQTADISFSAAHATTREGLAQALPQLRELLASQGLQLGQAGVGSGGTGHAMAGSNPWPQRQGPGANRPGTGLAGVEGGAGAAAPVTVAIRRGRGMLDLYA
ncbi:MAG: flagellar hook-length control protein FliK [Ramlibacter sp.]